ncbi:hypothetical protein HS088_TW07G01082 [Tripterygium wilfordii]|uniref:Uncharacterized protein n=1 Tax=Tripterygium wilfordii TaxID=458696 RepID=A0A7J7DHF9_TRIWF|nr:hypothetical protein HS088_TW07G01082 [Tripterygium wilfordii]
MNRLARDQQLLVPADGSIEEGGEYRMMCRAAKSRQTKFRVGLQSSRCRTQPSGLGVSAVVYDFQPSGLWYWTTDTVKYSVFNLCFMLYGMESWNGSLDLGVMLDWNCG